MEVPNEPGLSPNNGLENKFLSDQSKASQMPTLCQLVLTKIPDKCEMSETPASSNDKAISPQEGSIRRFATKQPLAPSGLTCRPLLLPMPTSGQSVDETLQAMELRWVAAMQPSSRGTARLSSEMSASLPAWMTSSQTPRLHWSGRQQRRQEQHRQQMQQQPAPQLPLDRSASDDIINVLEACGRHPQQAQWRHIWELAGASYLDRQQGPMVAPAAWQIDVWSLQSIHWQSRASTGQLPFLLLYQPQSASKHQPLVHLMPGCSHSH